MTTLEDAQISSSFKLVMIPNAGAEIVQLFHDLPLEEVFNTIRERYSDWYWRIEITRFDYVPIEEYDDWNHNERL